MHITFVTPEYPIGNGSVGGLGTYIKKTASSLLKRTDKVSVVIASNRHKVWSDKGVDIYEVRCPNLYYGLNSKMLIKQLLRVAIVYYSSWKCSRVVKAINRNCRIDLVQTTNFLSPALFLSKESFPLVARVSSYAPLMHVAYGLRRTFGDYLIDYLEIKQLQVADAIFSPSKYTANIYKQFEGLDSSLIPTVIESRQDQTEDQSLVRSIRKKLGGKEFLLYFGSMSRIKGVDLLADVINRTKKKYPDLSYVFIGKDYGMPDGQKVAEFILDRCIKNADNILFFPFQTKERLYPVIKVAKAVLIPSRIDNSPNACLEALSLETPVIATNDSSLEEIIEDGVTGYIAQNSSSIDIAQRVSRLLSLDAVDYFNLVENIKLKIREIEAEDRIGMLLKYYKDVISAHKNK